MSVNEIRSVVVVGSGNVAEAFACALSGSRYELRQVFARNACRGAAVAQLAGTRWCGELSQLADADLYLIAVSDRAVAEVAAALPIPAGAVMAHTAGCVPLDVLPADRRAVLYPFQTFTKGREVDFSEVPLFIEAATPQLEALVSVFACGLSRRVSLANGAQRRYIHLAGVFACNFANHMFAIGGRMLSQAGFSRELMHPIIAQTAAKACQTDDPATVQTGPAVRGDLATQEQHLALLQDCEVLETIYKSISRDIWETSKKI